MKKIGIKSKKYLDGNFTGNFKAVFHGHGIEFQDFREYHSDDDAKYIDWSASSKQGVTMIRRYQDEKQANLELIVDMSEGLFFEKNIPKYEVMKQLIEIFSEASYSSGLALGGYRVFENKNEYIKPRQSRLQKYFFLKKYTFTPRKLTPLSPEFLLKKRSQRKIYIFLSESLDIDKKSFQALSKMHDVIYLHISSHFENTLEGDELLRISGNNTDFTINLADKKKKEIYRKKRQEKLGNFSKYLAQIGILSAFFDETTDIYKELFLLMKKRSYSRF